jgi:glutamate dehydrogenase
VIAALPDLVVGSVADAAMSTVARLRDEGVSEDLARLVATSDVALLALPAVALGESHGVAPEVAARIQLLLDDRLGLDALRERITALPRSDRWQAEARAALRDDLYESQHALTAAVLSGTAPGAAPEARVEAWTADHADAVARYRSLVTDAEQAPVDLAALAVLRRALRTLASRD